MRTRIAAAVGVTAVIAALQAFSVVVGSAADPALSLTERILEEIPLFLFVAVGALLFIRQPRNVVGLLLVGTGASLALGSFADVYALRGTIQQPGSLPGAVWVAWLAQWVWIPGWSFAFILLPLLFPDGRPPTPRWRWAVLAALLLPSLQLIANALVPGAMTEFLPEELPVSLAPANPIGVAAFARVAPVIDTTVEGAFPLVFLAAVASLVVRYRRGSLVERLQIRWLLASTAAFLLAISVQVPALRMVTDPLAVVAVGAMPIAIAVAVTRYRLYEIDRIVNRAVVYLAVSAALVGVYVAIAVLPTTLLDLPDSDLIVAAATLAAAAVFGPAHRWIQAFVDRRFSRARYDAARTVDAFGQRLRNEVHLDALGEDLTAAVRTTVAPIHVGLWIKGSAV